PAVRLFGPWTVEEDRLLGTRPDPEVARLLGRTAEAVRQRRSAFGIAPSHPKIRPWTELELKALGTKPDEELAAELGRTGKAIEGQRRILHIRKFGSHYGWFSRGPRAVKHRPRTRLNPKSAWGTAQSSAAHLF